MRSRPSRLATLLPAVCAVGLLAAEGAQAQASNPRYLSWANRQTSTTPAEVAAAQNRARTGLIPRRVAPSQGLARPAMRPFNPPMPVVDAGLTPASAWIGPRVTPVYAPGSPAPVAYAATDLVTPPIAPGSAAGATPVLPTRSAEPAPTSVGLRASGPPASMPSSIAPPVDTAADPMAPRRDAPIFRIGGNGAPATAAQAEAAPSQAAPPSGQQARYYSVHRAAGRQPDATVMPEPVFFDSVALDLAEPPAVEQPMRDAQGRRRPVANGDPSLP